MSSSSDASLIALLNNVSLQLNRSFAVFIFLFGVVGNLFNMLVLSQRTLRSNPCAWLFLVSSIAYCINIVSSLIPRLLSTWNADIESTNQVLCKLRVFIFYDSITVASWLIVLATVDRWLLSNTDVNRRQKSTLKKAQRGLICVVILSTLIETEQLYCYEANLRNTPLKCYTKSATCSIVSDLSYALITILLPLLFMIVFGLMTIYNVHQVQSRVHPIGTITNGRVSHEPASISMGYRSQRKKTDRQLLIMLFVQVLIILTLTLPIALSKFYTTITSHTPKSALRSTIESFLFNFFLIFANIASGMPFYIYTLSGGSVFRKAVLSSIKMLTRKMKCQRD
jgi:hypothetical protein